VVVAANPRGVALMLRPNTGPHRCAQSTISSQMRCISLCFSDLLRVSAAVGALDSEQVAIEGG
jgi:hypothetical protein